MNDKLTQEFLKRCLLYDPVTGYFMWAKRDVSMFASPQAYNRYNTMYAGKAAGYINQKGYRIICINNKDIGAHRLAFLYIYGYMPAEIDHENQDPADNRISNLKDATHTENMRNMRRYKTNTSGVPGVNRRCDSGLWQARIGTGSGRVSLGCFLFWWDAVCARKSAENKHNYSLNHGATL